MRSTLFVKERKEFKEKSHRKVLALKKSAGKMPRSCKKSPDCYYEGIAPSQNRKMYYHLILNHLTQESFSFAGLISKNNEFLWKFWEIEECEIDYPHIFIPAAKILCFSQ